ncbi:MAG TPA: hypothetical protein VLF79_02785 [Candidatus Saccharimonadales bacterium]|nr:hypothetical protein [Candidatus Saccharimonadales bacterium]
MIPETLIAGASAGYVAGQLLEGRALKRVENQQARYFEATAPALEAETTSTINRIDRMMRWGSRRILTPLALVAASTGGLIGYAARSGETHTKSPAPLEVVVDRSGGTLTVDNGQPASLADKLISQLQDIKHVDPHAQVANYGLVQSTSLEQAIKIPPSGDADLAQATTTALGNAQPKGAVVVITNGNSIGSPNSVKEESTNTPIFIMNVQKSGSSATSNLRAIAHETGGKYWDAYHSDAGSAVSDIQRAVTPAEVKKPAEGSTDWGIIALSGILMVATAGLYRGRVDFKTGKGPKGE